jgi:hypothetical protein
MIEIAGSPNELVRPRTEPVDAARGDAATLQATQRSCLAVLRAEWSTLAVVSTEAGASGKAFARALVEAARSYRLRPVKDLSAAEPAPAQVPQLADALAGARGGDARAVMAVEDPVANPAVAPLVLEADAVLLLVRLGTTDLRTVEQIAELAGRERVIGCVIVG